MHVYGSLGLGKATLRGFIWSQRRELRGYMLWRIISVLAITPFPVLSQRIVDVAIPADDLRGVFDYTLLSLLLLVVHFVSMKIAVGYLSERTQEIFRRMRSRIFHKLNFMHFGFLDSIQTGRLLSKYAFDTNNIEATVIQIVTGIIPELLRSTLLIAALAYINIWLMVIVLVSIPIFAFVRVYYLKPIEDNNQAVRLAREKMTGQAAIDYLAKGRTTITIAHRLSTIRNADRIVVLNEGQCIAEGSWDELAAQEGAFRKLLDAQA